MNRRSVTNRRPGWRIQTFAVVALLVLAPMLTWLAPSAAIAQGSDQLAGRPLNFGDLVVIDRQFASNGAKLALERFYVDRGIISDPYLSAVAGSGGDDPSANQQVPFRNPAPGFSRNLLISRNYGYSPFQTEPHMAVDPTDPDHLVMGTIDYNMGSVMSVYVSWDAGETWEGPNQILYFRDDISGAGDPVVAFDRDGNVFISMISIGVRDFVLGSISSQVAVLNMAVAKSYDGGTTWTEPQLAASGAVSTVSNIDAEGKERGTITTVDLDKPWLTTGPNPDDPEQDIIYLSYTEFEQTSSVLYADELAFLSNPFLGTQIKVVASKDGGQTWSAPVPVSEQVFAGFSLAAPGQDTAQQQTGEGTFTSRVVQGSQVAVLADGRLAVCWYDSTDDGNDTGLATVGFSTSADGGTTFTRPDVAGTYREVPYRLRTANFRYGALPSMAAGPNGEVYVVQGARSFENPADDSDVILFRSFDGGDSWDPGIQVNDDDTDANQFFPQITVSPNGNLHIMWGDQRDDPVRLKYHIYYTESSDRGETFGFTMEDQGLTVPDTRVTDFPSNPMKGFPGGRFIGDYMAIAATDEDVYLVWPDTRLGEYGGYGQQIGFARKTAIEPPSLFLSPPSGSAGRIVDIQGFGFQPDSGIQLYVSGVITSQLRTDDEGQFQTSIYMPLTGEGPTEIRAFDETGNVATASFYTEFGFDTLQEQLDAISSQLGMTPEAEASPVADGTPEASAEVGSEGSAEDADVDEDIGTPTS
jgi:hypothetical protein